MSDDYKPERVFTVAEANRTLPLVRRITQDIQETYTRFAEKAQRFHRLWPEGGEGLSGPHREELEVLRDELERDQDALVGYQRELEKLGVLLKGPEQGLVDFPSDRDGRIVFLCWKLGEPEIAHWHEIEDGFSGRQPLEPAGQLAGSEESH